MADESKKKKQQKEAKAKDPGKGGKEQGEKKPVSAAAMFLICFLLFLLMVTGAFAVLYFNLFDMRTRTIVLLASGSSPYEHERNELIQFQEQLSDQGAQLELKEAQLIQLQESLDKRENAIVVEEERIAADREEVDLLFEAYHTRVAEFDQLVAMYGAMDPIKAAEALSLLENIDDIARLLSALKKDVAAKILNNMETSLAASVTQRMLP